MRTSLCSFPGYPAPIPASLPRALSMASMTSAVILCKPSASLRARPLMAMAGSMAPIMGGIMAGTMFIMVPIMLPMAAGIIGVGSCIWATRTPAAALLAWLFCTA